MQCNVDLPVQFAESPIKHYKHHSLVRAYQGDTFFWGLAPQPGDSITFNFEVSQQMELLYIVQHISPGTFIPWLNVRNLNEFIYYY